ncbi:MAG: DUF4238 domain-containing protein [Nitrosopumilus sp.]|nr:DUF4238 domain-containing protein [Nitrosopumilus sp.]
MAGIKSHFVPQFYLKNFGETFFHFDKKKDNKRKVNSKTVAHGSDFYGPVINGGHPLEALFSKIEGKANLAIKELIEKKDPTIISNTNFKNLCDFLALQYVRTQNMRIQIDDAIGYVIREMFSMDHPDIDKELIKDISLTEEYVLKLHFKALTDYPNLGQAINRMKFITIINKTKFPFWTSDNPISLFNSIDYSPYSGLGIIVEGIEIHFPINPTISLVVCDPKKFKNLPNTLTFHNDYEILRENCLQVNSSTRFLYSNMDRFYQIKKLLDEKKKINPKETKNTKKVISGKKLVKKQLKFWADSKILKLLKISENAKDRPPYVKPNVNSEYILTGFKQIKSKYDPQIQTTQF